MPDKKQQQASRHWPVVYRHRKTQWWIVRCQNCAYMERVKGQERAMELYATHVDFYGTRK